jgi:lysozyme
MTTVIPTQTPVWRRRGPLATVVGASAAALLMTFVPTHEGTVLKTYPDPAHGWTVPTACTGHTGPELKPGMTFTPPECKTMLEADLVAHAKGVDDCVDVEMSTGETVAYTSFAFNVGVAAFCKSTMAKLLNAGKRWEACAQLDRWVYAGGKVMRGLVTRRAAERETCEGDLK